MGARAENRPEDRLSGMAAFFADVGYKSTAEWKEEIVFFDSFKAPARGAADGSRPAIFPDGPGARLSPDQDPRVVFAGWLLAAQNPWFARNIVNRIWYWLQGRGIIHEPDDIRAGNPASNPELLAYLERELITAGYDWKRICRLILNSKTYQLSSVPGSEDAAGEAHFAFYPLRRLDAEVLIDAICRVTGTKE
ncbi:MAG: DUF1553 domain-containing protein [Acidobacteria bacterium]|nr:DUF1553 domain-containing protein [Acidobacteriota bacterium]